MSQRNALLLGCGRFADTSLAPLRSPERDVEELGRILREPAICGYRVSAEINCTSRQAQRAIEAFFAAARIGDGMNLLYLSCHGVQDAQGRLYFAFADTETALLSSTAVAADWVRDRIYASRSKATVVLVDCCFSGAFIKGMQARSGTQANVAALVRDLPEGSGVAVLTASGDSEISFEDATAAEPRPSYFTEAVIDGISTGAADLNRDGWITVDELYDFVYRQVVSGRSPQRPRKLGMGEGTLVVAGTTVPTRQSNLNFAAGVDLAPGYQPSWPNREASRPVLHARGVLAYLSFDGQWIVIGKDGVGHAFKSERRFHVSQVSGVAFQPATRLYHGYFQIILTGVPAAPVARFGPHSGRPPMEDGNSISFARGSNEAVLRIRGAIQDAIDANRGHVSRGKPHPVGERIPGPADHLVRGRRTPIPWLWIGRAALWVVALALGVGEIGAVALTVTDGWPQHTLTNTVVGLTCWTLPFVGVLTVIYLDLRRLRRSSREP